MKSISEFIYESKSFTLKDGERKALYEFIGYLSDNYEDTDKEFTSIKVDDEDKETLNSVFDILDDENTYNKVNKRILKEELPVLQKYLKIAWNKNLMNRKWDLMDAFDKIYEN